jgi:hypothetical protein
MWELSSFSEAAMALPECHEKSLPIQRNKRFMINLVARDCRLIWASKQL